MLAGVVGLNMAAFDPVNAERLNDYAAALAAKFL